MTTYIQSRLRQTTLLSILRGCSANPPRSSTTPVSVLVPLTPMTGHYVGNTKLYLNGTYDYGYANDLALSRSGDVLYAAEYYTFLGWSNIINFVTLDTTTGSQLWNLTSPTYYSLNDIEISSNGMVYALSSFYPSYNIITINTSNQSITGNVSISNPINPYGLSLSFNENQLYVPTSRLEA